MEETYPSGRKVKNVLDNDGELSLVQSARCGVVNGVTATCSDPQGYFSYAKSFSYNAAGAVTSMQLGNGRWETTQFNSRLQPTQIGLGTVQNATDKLKLDYEYGTTDNNGNITKQTINTGSATLTQTYLYDSRNRLTEAKEVDASSQQTWKQNFGYDRYGNRTTFAEYAGAALTNDQTPQIDAANNRFTTSSGFVYDLSGNVITDNLGRTFDYDAENKQTQVKDQYGTIIGEYYYDGDGKRVKKYVPSTGETTIFAYDASGKLVAEYSTIVASSQDAKVAYLTTDHLGSPRINTDHNGAVIARHDYHPFGEEIFTAQRTTGLNYSADSVRKQFTGYERDSETDLDFAQARMYANRLGRFSCPDYFFNDTNPVNPQKWNLYGYVLNNPLNFTDPTGEIIETENGKIKFDPAKDSKGANIQKEKSILEGRNKAGNTVIFTAVYTQGTIYTDSKTPVEAEQLDREKGVTMRTYDKDGNVISQTTISVDDARKGGIRPESNCFGSAFANQEVWINNDKGQVAKIIAGDNYSLTTSPSRDDVGLYFRGKQGVAGESGDANFDKVRHATTVWEVAEGKVSIVISKDKATLAVTAEPGPGKNTAWPERKTHIRYYSKGN